MTSVNYLSREQFEFRHLELIKQLYDQAIRVLKKISDNELAIMFNIELAFLKKTLLKWFNKKVAPPFKRLDDKIIREYEKEFCWSQERKCAICKMSLCPIFSSASTPNNEMYYGDFIIRYEYAFLKNIFSEEQLQNSNDLKSLDSYYKMFEEFIDLSIQIYRILNNSNLKISDISINARDFIENNFSDCDIELIKEEIFETDIKNALKTCKYQIPKINLKIYAFLYDALFCFPFNGELDSITSNKFFTHVHNQIKQKLHIHHSHITGQIFGYTHDFCNKRVVELQNPEIPCIAHNLFGFDFSTTAWQSKNLNCGGVNLTNLNFASISAEIKFIDSLKYYQRSLAELTSSMDKIEIEMSKKSMIKFLTNHYYFSTIWSFISGFDQEKILKITCEGKGVIPYELVKDMNSFLLEPENDFWLRNEFYSELKQKHVTEEEYNESKYLYKTLKMRHLGDLNDLYNAQDVILLTELIENRFQFMQDKYGFNPRKCNSASTLSGCIEREMSKVIISFPTTIDHHEIFEKTITGGFSCVNTRLVFDTSILLPKKNEEKDRDWRIIYNINGEKKRVISKILKLDETNQYGHAMTKPLPTGSIKDNPDLSWRTFNFLIESVSLEDKKGHLYIVDIEFDYKNASKKQIIYNEIYPPIVEKQKTIDPNEKSVYQLLDNFREGKDDVALSYKVTAKAHSTLLTKTFIPLYLEDLVFVIKRYGWRVTKIHKHITFDQAPFKKNFILMNQKSRQESKTNAEKDFYKLMNNSNFGSDCRNNADNIDFVPIFDEINEINSLKKYYSLVDPRIENFVSGSLIEEYVNNTFNNKFHKLNKNDPFYDIKLSTLKQEQNEGLASAKKFSEKKKKLKRKNTIVDYFDRVEEAQQNTNIKSLIEFDYSHSNSIKAVIAKQNTNIKPTTRFLSGKMLMFAKVSIKSFVCDIIDVFMFPDETIQSIYRKFNIEKCFLYQCLTDTDSTSLNFIFICNLNCVVDEINSRKIIFEVLISSKLIDRLDLSDDFWSDFNVQNKKLKKQVGLFEIESINSPNIITIAINPKEYQEEFDNLSNNKKHKGIKKGTPGMDFDAYFSKLYNITDYFESVFKNNKKKPQKILQKRFQIIDDMMQMKTVNKIQFGQLNDKRFYFPNGIVSLPFGHFLFNDIRKERYKFRNIHKVIQEKKWDFIKKENEVINKNERLSIFYQIINGIPLLYTLNSKEPVLIQKISTKEYIEKKYWK